MGRKNGTKNGKVFDLNTFQHSTDRINKGKVVMKTGVEMKSAETALAERLRIKELDEHIPLGNDGLVNESNIFRWYRVKDEKDYQVLNTVYGNAVREPSVYPEIICVETVGQEAYQGDAYAYHLADCRKITEDFWKQMGYKCRIEKE